MTVVDLIKILAGVCRFNPNGEVYLHVDGKDIPIHHCIDNFIDVNNSQTRVIVLVAKGDDYYGD